MLLYACEAVCFISCFYLNTNSLNKNERRNSMSNIAIKIRMKIQRFIVEVSLYYERKVQ